MAIEGGDTWLMTRQTGLAPPPNHRLLHGVRLLPMWKRAITTPPDLLLRLQVITTKRHSHVHNGEQNPPHAKRSKYDLTENLKKGLKQRCTVTPMNDTAAVATTLEV